MNPLFESKHSPTKTTKPTKAVNNVDANIKLAHNTFDNSFFNFKTQRYGQYEPFWWKVCVAGDNEPFSNSHNVRSLPFASPILSPLKLNKDYFQVPMYAIQPNAWDYIFKNPVQGDDVPFDSQNLFPLFDESNVRFDLLFGSAFNIMHESDPYSPAFANAFLTFCFYENFFSSGSLLFSLGYKFHPQFFDSSAGKIRSYDYIYDYLFRLLDFEMIFTIDDPDSPTGVREISVNTLNNDSSTYVDKFTFASLLRSHFSNIVEFRIIESPEEPLANFGYAFNFDKSGSLGVDSIRMDVINAYQLACAQYYVNPRVDFLYNAQLYRDNFVNSIRELYLTYGIGFLEIQTFDYNGIPVLYDYLSYKYYHMLVVSLCNGYSRINWSTDFDKVKQVGSIIYYLFGYREQLRFGDYLTDSRTQRLGYGEPGSDVVQVMDNSVSVTDMTQKLVLERFRSAVAHLDNSAEDYLETMFHEQLPPDYHYPKFIVHSEFGINGEEISNTTSDNQGTIVTNLKSGDDSAAFNIDISVNSILIGISYISVPAVYSQIKERTYMHEDRYDMFQPMLQYFGDQQIYNREVSDVIPNPSDSYGYVSRNGEYKQRMSQCSGAFLNSLRSWLFTVDLPESSNDFNIPRLSYTQSPVSIRSFDYEFNRFFKQIPGISLGTGFHFIMQYNNKNMDNRPMDVSPLPLYPSNSL